MPKPSKPKPFEFNDEQLDVIAECMYAVWTRYNGDLAAFRVDALAQAEADDRAIEAHQKKIAKRIAKRQQQAALKNPSIVAQITP